MSPTVQAGGDQVLEDPEQFVEIDVARVGAPIASELVDRYAADGARLIRAEVGPSIALGCRPVTRDLLGSGPLIRHDPHKLARAVLELADGSIEGCRTHP